MKRTSPGNGGGPPSPGSGGGGAAGSGGGSKAATSVMNCGHALAPATPGFQDAISGSRAGDRDKGSALHRQPGRNGGFATFIRGGDLSLLSSGRAQSGNPCSKIRSFCRLGSISGWPPRV